MGSHAKSRNCPRSWVLKAGNDRGENRHLRERRNELWGRWGWSCTSHQFQDESTRGRGFQIESFTFPLTVQIRDDRTRGRLDYVLDTETMWFIARDQFRLFLTPSAFFFFWPLNKKVETELFDNIVPINWPNYPHAMTKSKPTGPPREGSFVTLETGKTSKTSETR